MKESTDTIHIFWTGGWDSTFRLIQALLTTEAKVQPHYIIRAEKSTGIEIYTMILIRRAINETYPEVRSRFIPTQYINADMITEFEDIDQQVDKLRKTAQINEQYRLMAHYCRQFGIEKVEVSLEKSPVPEEDSQEWLEKTFQNAPAFNCFAYPVFELTKSDMYEIAKANDWVKIMNLTSFCRRPNLEITPCGSCGSCSDAVKSGMGFRFPLKSRIKARIQIPLRKYWRNNYEHQKNKWFFKWIQRLFESRM
jgi:hypothetical protein